MTSNLMTLSQNFQLSEFVRSNVAAHLHIDNTPSAEVIDNLRHLCQNVLQPLRDHLGVPVVVTSGFRCPRLNSAVGGVATSQHLRGEAADIRIPDVPCRLKDGTVGQRQDLAMARTWMQWIANSCPFDQLILEHNAAGRYWIHVSLRRDASRNRRQILELQKK